MLETITSEELISYGLLGVSALVIAGSIYVIWPRRQKGPRIDIEAAVRNAPYHLLDR